VSTPPATGAWQVYILECRDGTLYTGIAIDLERRLEAHQRGTASRYTRARLPVRLLHHEPHTDRSSALRREAAIKKMSRARKLSLGPVPGREGLPE
jgi:putative endonuclease